ncbi:MAG: hypothetical protein NC078_06330 [Ruminococcus sp.]|nr:hypothetical protein [Ruminococcus sp.]
MDRRHLLHEALCEALGSGNVYFQPPESLKIKYPAIVYQRSRINVKHADNAAYLTTKTYEITVIDTDPDGKIADKVSRLPRCGFDRHFVGDNLYHDVFTITF